MVQNVAYIVSRHQLYLETMLDYQEFAQLQDIYKSMTKNTKIISVFLCAFKEAELNCVKTNIL
jgi:hypothetical protein